MTATTRTQKPLAAVDSSGWNAVRLNLLSFSFWHGRATTTS